MMSVEELSCTLDKEACGVEYVGKLSYFLGGYRFIKFNASPKECSSISIAKYSAPKASQNNLKYQKSEKNRISSFSNDSEFVDTITTTLKILIKAWLEASNTHKQCAGLGYKFTLLKPIQEALQKCPINFLIEKAVINLKGIVEKYILQPKQSFQFSMVEERLEITICAILSYLHIYLRDVSFSAGRPWETNILRNSKPTVPILSVLGLLTRPHKLKTLSTDLRPETEESNAFAIIPMDAVVLYNFFEGQDVWFCLFPDPNTSEPKWRIGHHWCETNDNCELSPLSDSLFKSNQEMSIFRTLCVAGSCAATHIPGNLIRHEIVQEMNSMQIELDPTLLLCKTELEEWIHYQTVPEQCDDFDIISPSDFKTHITCRLPDLLAKFCVQRLTARRLRGHHDYFMQLISVEESTRRTASVLSRQGGIDGCQSTMGAVDITHLPQTIATTIVLHMYSLTRNAMSNLPSINDLINCRDRIDNMLFDVLCGSGHVNDGLHIKTTLYALRSVIQHCNRSLSELLVNKAHYFSQCFPDLHDGSNNFFLKQAADSYRIILQKSYDWAVQELIKWCCAYELTNELLKEIVYFVVAVRLSSPRLYLSGIVGEKYVFEPTVYSALDKTISEGVHCVLVFPPVFAVEGDITSSKIDSSGKPVIKAVALPYTLSI